MTRRWKSAHNVPSGSRGPVEMAQAECIAAAAAFRSLDEAVGRMRECEAARARGADADARAARALSDIGVRMTSLWRELSLLRNYCGSAVNDRTVPSKRERGPCAPASDGSYALDRPWRRSAELACPACRSMLMIGPMEGEAFCPHCRRMVEDPAWDPYDIRANY